MATGLVKTASEMGEYLGVSKDTARLLGGIITEVACASEEKGPCVVATEVTMKRTEKLEKSSKLRRSLLDARLLSWRGHAWSLPSRKVLNSLTLIIYDSDLPAGLVV